MGKLSSVAFCTLMVCILVVNVGIALATEAGYGNVVEPYSGAAVTVDGKWGSGEWTTDGAWIDNRFNVSNSRFGYKMDMSTGAYYMSWLVEWHDTTNDATDKWILCIDGAYDGAATPQADDVKIEITGHRDLTVSAGTGTGWGANSSTLAAAVKWKDSLATSSYDAVNHWVVEIQADKASLGAWGQSPPPEGFYVAMYDASSPTQIASWPPGTPVNVPSRWGAITDYTGTIPEGLTVGFLVLLSSAAVLLGSFFVRRRRIVNNSAMAIR